VSVDVYRLSLVISGFCREVDENCTLLGHNAASSGHFLPTFCDNLTVSSLRGKNKKRLEEGTDRLPRNVGTNVPLLAA